MSRKKQEVSRREALLSELASDCESPEEFMALLKDLKKSLLEKALVEAAAIAAMAGRKRPFRESLAQLRFGLPETVMEPSSHS